MCGLPCSGKTTLAKRLEPLTQAQPSHYTPTFPKQ
ncbi:MAG: hypothetical protein ACRCYY_14865 [Trueperaceae bacterium]